MKQRILIAAGLLLVSSAVLADMFQDAGNAKLPDARQNLELGTTRSEGSNLPNADAVTRFYTYSNAPGDLVNYGTKVQFQVNSEPDAADYAVEQAGKSDGDGQGQGATRLCTTILGSTANCNYMSLGKNSIHLFGNGAGRLLEIGSVAAAPVNAWPKLLPGDDATARLWVMTGATVNASLELKPKGAGSVNIASTTGGPPLSLIGSPGGAQPAVISSPAAGVQINGHRAVTHTNLGAYTVPSEETGTHYHNTGAVGASTLTLPPAVVTPGLGGVYYCFSVDAAFSVVVKAAGTDKIAIGASNSAAGGQISATQPYASICLETHKTGQWFATSTPDKSQWTVL
jgi:hypothetical protein